MIKIDDSNVTELPAEYGVKRYADDREVIDFGDNELSAAIDVAVFGGVILTRRVFVTDWEPSSRQPLSSEIPADDLIGGDHDGSV
jgi:hypothetical protein